MIELGTPATLMDAQMGHADGSVQVLYSHITPEMVERLIGGLTASWTAALAARREFSPRSPVVVLDRLLTESVKIVSQVSPSSTEQRETGSARVERNPL
jgi:hypothetical protein